MENKIKNFDRNKGITLIALVITIIVLLILAGVSIAMLTGENGILTQAQRAKAETEIAEVKERAQMDILDEQTESRTELTKSKFIEILNKYFKDVPTEENFPEDLTSLILETKEEYGSHEIKISEIYNGELTVKQKIAGEVLKVNPDGEEAKDKSPYVKYNNMLCRVLYNDETHGIQIITADNRIVPNVTLGPGDDKVTVNDFFYDGSLTLSDDFKKAAASYNNVVDNLNERASEYMDEKGIAKDARSLGSIATLKDGKFQGDITSDMYTDTGYAYFGKYGFNGKFKEEDTNYTDDVTQLKSLGLNSTLGETWLASRHVGRAPAGYYFYVLYVNTSGVLYIRQPLVPYQF